MGSLVNPRPWVPYLNIKDCSQGFCSIYCPQWCYTVFPPPPPIDFPSKNRGLTFSPLIFAIIGILASAFLLVSYYAIISKYCNDSSSRRRQRHDPNEESEENEDPLTLEPWHVANNGLDDGLIKSIAVCKYKRGHSLFEATDCSVCLSEFGEDESVKLLPKCSHAFHVVCIDTWLKSHSNCPLCRTNIVSISPTPPSLPSPRSESPPNIESVLEGTRNEVILEDIEMGTIRREETVRNGDVSNEEDKDIVIEIADENTKQIRRSVSMDFDCGQRLSLAEVLLLNQNVDFWDENGCSRNYEVGSSKGKLSKMFKFGNRDGGLHCVNNPVSIKRSFSSGRFSFSKRGRGCNMIIPL